MGADLEYISGRFKYSRVYKSYLINKCQGPDILILQRCKYL